VDLDLSTPSLQNDQSSSNGNLISAGNLASVERVFVGSIKSNKYHYPWSSAAPRKGSNRKMRFGFPALRMPEHMDTFLARYAIRLEPKWKTNKRQNQAKNEAEQL
jgi:hypothetical protein